MRIYLFDIIRLSISIKVETINRSITIKRLLFINGINLFNRNYTTGSTFVFDIIEISKVNSDKGTSEFIKQISCVMHKNEG